MNELTRSEIKAIQGALALYAGRITEREFRNLFYDFGYCPKTAPYAADYKIKDLIDKLEHLHS